MPTRSACSKSDASDDTSVTAPLMESVTDIQSIYSLSPVLRGEGGGEGSGACEKPQPAFARRLPLSPTLSAAYRGEGESKITTSCSLRVPPSPLRRLLARIPPAP